MKRGEGKFRRGGKGKSDGFAAGDSVGYQQKPLFYRGGGVGERSQPRAGENFRPRGCPPPKGKNNLDSPGSPLPEGPDQR